MFRPSILLFLGRGNTSSALLRELGDCQQKYTPEILGIQPLDFGTFMLYFFSESQRANANEMYFTRWPRELLVIASYLN